MAGWLTGKPVSSSWSLPPPQPFSVNSQTALDSFPMRVHNAPAEALSASPHELIKIPCVIFLHLLQGRIFSHVWMLAVCERVLTVSDALYSICHVQRYVPTEALAGRMDKLLQGALLRVLSGTIRRTQQIKAKPDTKEAILVFFYISKTQFSRL